MVFVRLGTCFTGIYGLLLITLQLGLCSAHGICDYYYSHAGHDICVVCEVGAAEADFVDPPEEETAEEVVTEFGN